MMIDCIESIRRNCINGLDKVAVIDGNREVSYGEFYKIYNRISLNLKPFAEKPKIILDLHQSVESYALIVAINNLTESEMDYSFKRDRYSQL